MTAMRLNGDIFFHLAGTVTR